MESSQIYILISLGILLTIFLVLFFLRRNKKQKRMTILSSLAFAFVIAGIVFRDNQIMSYIFLGMGILLAIIDAIRKIKK